MHVLFRIGGSGCVAAATEADQENTVHTRIATFEHRKLDVTVSQ